MRKLENGTLTWGTIVTIIDAVQKTAQNGPATFLVIILPIGELAYARAHHQDRGSAQTR